MEKTLTVPVQSPDQPRFNRFKPVAPHAHVLIALTLLAFVPALFPALDLWAASLFIGPSAVLHAADWPWVVWINDHVPTVARGFFWGALALAIGLRLSRRHMDKIQRAFYRHALFVSIGLILGPGLTVMGAKHYWERARPLEVAEFGGPQVFTPALEVANQCATNCAFFSGHVSSGFFLATLLVLGGRWRWWFFAAGMAMGLAVGFSRMAAGAHWLSDVLWAYPATLAVSILVWWGIHRATGGAAPESGPPGRPSINPGNP